MVDGMNYQAEYNGLTQFTNVIFCIICRRLADVMELMLCRGATAMCMWNHKRSINSSDKRWGQANVLNVLALPPQISRLHMKSLFVTVKKMLSFEMYARIKCTALILEIVLPRTLMPRMLGVAIRTARHAGRRVGVAVTFLFFFTKLWFIIFGPR